MPVFREKTKFKNKVKRKGFILPLLRGLWERLVASGFCLFIDCVTECIVCVQGHDPLNIFPVILSLLLIRREFYGPNYPKS